MNNCKSCGSSMVLDLTAKCSDLCSCRLGNAESQGYVPFIQNIGGGDYIDMSVCLSCGQVQGDFPANIDLDAFEELGGP